MTLEVWCLKVVLPHSKSQSKTCIFYHYCFYHIHKSEHHLKVTNIQEFGLPTDQRLHLCKKIFHQADPSQVNTRTQMNRKVNSKCWVQGAGLVVQARWHWRTTLGLFLTLPNRKASPKKWSLVRGLNLTLPKRKTPPMKWSLVRWLNLVPPPNPYCSRHESACQY